MFSLYLSIFHFSAPSFSPILLIKSITWAVLLLLLAPIIAYTTLYLIQITSKIQTFVVLTSAPTIHLHEKNEICTYSNNCHTVITTFLLTQMVIQTQVFGLVDFHRTHNERTCVCLWGMTMAKYNTIVRLAVWWYNCISFNPCTEWRSLSLLNTYLKKILCDFQGRCLSPNKYDRKEYSLEKRDICH